MCWIKGVPAFDTLRQAVSDPERAYVGAEPPTPAAASQIIDRIAIENAPWAQTPVIHLNPGLVAVIIVAEVGTASAGGLPPIRYHSGGLDEKPIPTLVCNILEGGELAFRDRARRLRIGLRR